MANVNNKELQRDLALALACHFGVAVQTGNHQHILESLDLQIELSEVLPKEIQDYVFEIMKPSASKFVKQMIEVLEKRQEQRLHYL